MNLKKPKFWDYNKPNIYAYLLFPITVIIKVLSNLSKKLNKIKSKKQKIKTICVGNFYVGGTGKTSLSIEINKILRKKILNHVSLKRITKIK